MSQGAQRSVSTKMACLAKGCWRSPKIISDDRGFSLTEVLVASLILTGVVVGFLRAFTSAQTLSSVQVDRSARVYSASEKLEALGESVRRDWWDSPDRPMTVGMHDEQVSGVGIKYEVTSVNPTGGDTSEDYRKVVVTHSS